MRNLKVLLLVILFLSVVFGSKKGEVESESAKTKEEKN
jgi:hypothetical protein